MSVLRRFWTASLFAIAFCFVSAVAANAQQVIGISAILGSTDSTHIDTWSATEMDAVTAYYYDAYVEGYLFQNNGQIAAGYAYGNPTAAGGFTRPLTVGDSYEIDSYHYLVAYYAYDDGYNSFYYNPLNYFSGGDGGGYPSGYGFSPGGGSYYYEQQYIYLGYTTVWLQTGRPSITSISPTSGSTGSSGPITVQGSFLEDPFTQWTTAAVTGSGMTLSVQSVTPTQVTLNYSIAQSASAGSHNLTLATRFGTSNAVSFNVGDRTPVVQNVSPNAWPAGANTQITITGTGFGANPSVTTNGTGVSITVNSAGDTQITATVSVAASAPDQTVTVQVQSNGYNGGGFISTTQGQSSVGTNTATVQAIAAPAPQIMFMGNNIAGTTQLVVVGQQIALTSSVNLPAGLTITSQSWSAPQGTAVGGYSASTAAGSVTPLPSMTGASFNFYWVDSGNSRQITYAYTLNNGRSNSATATFNVDGPSGSSIQATPHAVNVWPAGVANQGNSINPWLEFGNANTVNGMDFVASANHLPAANQGSYSWVQLLGTNSQVYNPGSTTTTLGIGLDNGWYPYPMAPGCTNCTNDSPGIELLSGNSDENEVFSATMYLMWTPNAASGCGTGGACTIPVPLGSVTWKFKGDAINTLDPRQGSNGWVLGCGQASVDPFQASNSYPIWNSSTRNIP